VQSTAGAFETVAGQHGQQGNGSPDQRLPSGRPSLALQNGAIRYVPPHFRARSDTWGSGSRKSSSGHGQYARRTAAAATALKEEDTSQHQRRSYALVNEDDGLIGVNRA